MDHATSINATQRGESPALAHWQEAGKWFNYGEQTIFSRIDGQGEALLLIHGFPTASWDWHRLWPLVLPRHQLLALDMVGFGFSDKPADYDYSVIDQATLHQGWLQTLGVERVHIIAHDYGCSVAQELLAREQEGTLECKIASVCFLNGALFPEMHRPMLIQKLLVSPVGGLVSRGITRQVFEFNLTRIFGPDTRPSREDLEDFWQLLIFNNGRGILHRLIRYMEERRCHRNRWVSALQRARQPLQLISGQADPVSGQPMADRYAALLPGADLQRLDHIGHYPHFEAPRTVWERYRAFRGL
ncbi:alpha/beta hydrolase [Marinobacteraceae bacterium S3BR75-40.1]